MKKFQIINKNNDSYILIDKNKKEYSITLELHDTNINPTINDSIYASKKLFDKNNEQNITYYVFGAINSIYGRKIENENDDDILIIESQNKEKVVLKRLYG